MFSELEAGWSLRKFLQFHVDKLSSAHIYLRMREGETWDSIPEELVQDCAQLTKANSIEGMLTSLSPLERI